MIHLTKDWPVSGKPWVKDAESFFSERKP